MQLSQARRSMLNMFVVFVMIYLAFCALLFVFQRSMLYLPQPAPAGDSATAWTLPVEGAELRINRVPFDGPQAVLYFGGNAETVAYSVPELAAAFPRHALFLMNYRGYGGSSGSPSEQVLLADALALYDRVQAEHPQIVIVGRSLGSGVATYLASMRPAVRLVLVTPYDSIQAIAERHYPFVPVRWLLHDKYESWKHAGKIDIPTLLVVAEFDEVIPRRSSEALARHFRDGVATLKVIAGTSHNTVSDSPEYVRLLAETR